MFIIPLFATLGNALGVVVDKITLSKHKVSLKVFYPLLFVFLCFFAGALLPFLGHIDLAKAFSNYYLVIFGAMIFSALIWNIFYYKGLQKEHLYEFELIITLTPLMTTFIASLLLIEERNWHIIAPAIIASLALLMAHIKKDHLAFSEYSVGILIAVLFMSLEMVLIKILLQVYSPVSLYFIRTLIIMVVFLFYFRPNVRGENFTHIGLIVLSSLAGVLQMVLKFYSFDVYGVIYTNLIMTLAPILVYLSCIFVLKEKISFRAIIAGCIILVCIVWATIR